MCWHVNVSEHLFSRSYICAQVASNGVIPCTPPLLVDNECMELNFGHEGFVVFYTLSHHDG